MNEIIEIKELLDRYYEGESSDADEQRLREYFTSEEVPTELQPYRSIFAYLQHEKEAFQVSGFSDLKFEVPCLKFQVSRWWYAAAAVACLLAGTFFIHEFQPKSNNLCTGTYVMINGICYDDIALVSKYATETIDLVTQPFSDGSATDALDFLD